LRRSTGSRGFVFLLAALAPSAGCRTLPAADPAPRPPQAVAAPPAAEARAEVPPEPLPVFAIPSASKQVTWTCAGSPCPWGASLKGHAVVWPPSTQAASKRLGYSVSDGVYLPAAAANGATIVIRSGSATVNAGALDRRSHRLLATLSPGTPYRIVGITPGNFVSVQSDSTFSYVLDAASAHAKAPPAGEGLHAVLAFWSCDAKGCEGSDWPGMTISWPPATAYQSNGRAGVNGRSVFSLDGEPLYPYMGPWADGCKVTSLSGDVLIIEWKRGTDQWRKTLLKQGQSHVISLKPPEDGALIETDDDATSPGFSVTLENCTPKPLARGAERDKVR
jgi:hypothetical protein